MSFVLRLYVAGGTGRSQMAIDFLSRVCGERPDVELEIVDVLKRPDIAEAERILATPTLVRMLPLPRRRLVGSMEDTARVRAEMGLGG